MNQIIRLCFIFKRQIIKSFYMQIQFVKFKYKVLIIKRKFNCFFEMGNKHQHENIRNKIGQMQIVKRSSSYCILQSQEGTEYIKFTFSASKDDKEYHQLRGHRNNSIFNKKYLQFRYQCQVQNKEINTLPRIIAYGQQVQNLSLISCQFQKLNFVMFQHPKQTLKQYVEGRIMSNHYFQQVQILSLVKSVFLGLAQLYEHVQSWSEYIFQRKNFLLTDQDIYVNKQGNFILSDVLSSFNDIEHILKQQVTIKKANRTSSLSNLHSKLGYRKTREKYFQSNLSNLVSIVQGIIFKFECSSQPHKSSLQQSQSMSTALQSNRGSTKFGVQYSHQLQNLLKQLKRKPIRENQFGDRINSFFVNYNCRQIPTYNLKFNSRKSSKQNIIKDNFPTDNQKLNEICPQAKSIQINSPLEVIQQQQSNTLKQINYFPNLGKYKQNKITLLNQVGRNVKDEENVKENVNPKPVNRNNKKLHLSLKDDCQLQARIQNKQNVLEQRKPFCRESSYPQDLLKQNQYKQQNIQQIVLNDIDPASKSQGKFQRKRSQSVSIQTINQNIFKKKLSSQFQEYLPSQHPKDSTNRQQYKSRAVTLRKPESCKVQFQLPQQLNPKKQQQKAADTLIHLNPLSKKRNLGFKKLFNCNNIENFINFKTIQKGINEVDVQLIENLSSIVSNHNNTLSSYGSSLTGQFSTENSQIQEEGTVASCQVLCQGNKSDARSRNAYMDHFIKMTSIDDILVPPCIKLSSFQSLELLDSTIQRPQDKIPQFLKQFKLPQKHLLALNNIVLKQKDMILEQSLEQSDLNSIRNSILNMLSIQDQLHDGKSRRDSKTDLQKFDQIQIEQSKELCLSVNNHNFSSILAQQQTIYYLEQNIFTEKQGDSIQRQLRCIEFSLINTSSL